MVSPLYPVCFGVMSDSEPWSRGCRSLCHHQGPRWLLSYQLLQLIIIPLKFPGLREDSPGSHLKR